LRCGTLVRHVHRYNSHEWNEQARHGRRFLGWTMDAFDYFVVIFMLDVLAAQFHVDKKEIVWTLTH